MSDGEQNIRILTTTSSMILYHKSYIYIYIISTNDFTLHSSTCHVLFIVAVVDSPDVKISTCNILLLLLTVLMQTILYANTNHFHRYYKHDNSTDLLFIYLFLCQAILFLCGFILITFLLEKQDSLHCL